MNRPIEDKPDYLYGFNSINSLVRINSGNRKIFDIKVNEEKLQSGRFSELVKLAHKKGIKIKMMKRDVFNYYSEGISRVLDSFNHQGIIAEVSEYNYGDFKYLLSGSHEKEIIMILDSVSDVGNFASIIRNCSAFGVKHILIPKDRSVSVNNKISSISAGALEELKIYRVPNLVAAIKKLKQGGFWIYGTTLEKGKEVKDISEIEYLFPMGLVMGSEHRGMRRLVQDNCDVLIRIGMADGVQSLNVSVASGIFLYSIQESGKIDNE